MDLSLKQSKMWCSALLLLLATVYVTEATVFRQPVVFPPLDVSKYLDASDVDLQEQQIMASDGVVPEENHEHADESAFDEGLAADPRDDPIVVARRSLLSPKERTFPWHHLYPRLV